MQKNNIEFIENFLSVGVDDTLIINQVSEEIYCFYDFVIRILANELNVKPTYEISINNTSKTNELFETKEVIILNIKNTKLLEDIASKNFQKIIFTDYKSYKKLAQNYKSINGYDFERDIRYFFTNYNNIHDDDLINYCIHHPYLTLSELTKYQINGSSYLADPIKNDTSNFILQIRGEIFKLKRNRFDLKDFFTKLKKEVKYKKFNFLTY